MTSPFAPRSYRVRAPERAPDMPPFLRLHRAGLLDSEDEEVQRRWDAMTNAERIEAGDALDLLDDDELRRQVVEMREEMAIEAAAASYTDADLAVATTKALQAAYPDGLPKEPPKRRTRKRG